MPVSYPAVMPTSGVTSIQWTNTTSSLVSRSPFSLKGQAQSWSGAIRFASVTVENLNREQAEDWIGFLDSLHGTLGTFLFGDPHAVVPLGTGGGSPKVLAVSTSTRDVITINGGPTGSTRPTWLKRGDWIQLGTGLNARLYKVMQDVSVNSTGVSGNIILWPKFRINPVAGDTVIINNPKGLFRRANGSYSYSEDNGCKFSLAFDIEEVI